MHTLKETTPEPGESESPASKSSKTNQILTIDYTPDGKRFATAGSDTLVYSTVPLS